MKNIFFHRDFLIFVLLIVMLKVGTEMRESTINAAPILLAPANHIAQAVPSPEHPVSQEPEKISKNTAHSDEWEVTGDEEQIIPEPFLVHEVDQNILKQMECAQTQINAALKFAQPASLDAAQLRSLQQRVTQLRSQYQSTTPAMAFLGPLGTAAVVLKEENIEKELLNTVHKISAIIHNLADNKHKPTDSIVKELEQNHTLLFELTRT